MLNNQGILLVRLLSLITCLSSSFCAHAANAELLIISNHATKFEIIHPKELKLLWMGKKKRLQGIPVQVVDQKDGNQSQAAFYKKVLNKNSNQMRAYWAKLLFSGSSFPPRQVQDDSETIEWVSNHPNYIGYIDAKSMQDSVRTLLVIK